jgi:threonine aldolase
MPRSLHEAMLNGGAHHYEWPGLGPGTDIAAEGECFVRFVTSYRTRREDVERLRALAGELSKQKRALPRECPSDLA